MITWIKKILISKYVKGVLDKIPFNNYKTYLGLVILILGAIQSGLGSSHIVSVVIAVILETLNQINGVVPITDAGVVVLITGLVHKLIKKVA